MRMYTVAALLVLALSFVSQPLLAQHGHPLVGTWSGDLTGGERPIRVVLALDFNVDQTISGFIIANGNRLPLTSATLDPHAWQVSLVAQGQNRAGDRVSYQIHGTIENLGSATDRAIAGTWQEGGNEGDFRVVINE
jgi:hypothetical protein